MKNKGWEVVVAGGGTAGVIAAIAAARLGARTLLIEKYGFPGGVCTYGIPFLAFIAGNGTRVVDGIPQELVERMTAHGGSSGHFRGGYWRTGEEKSYGFAVTPYETEIYKYAALKLLEESGAKMMLHTAVSDVNAANGHIDRLETIGVGGRQWIEGRMFIDATGDGQLFASAGFPYRKGDARGHMQNVSLMFNMGGVRINETVSALEKNDGFSGTDKWHTRIITGKKLCGTNGYIHFAGHMHPWRDERKYTFTAVSAREGIVSLNITRTTDIDGIVPDELTKAEIAERENVVILAAAMKKNIRGFEDSYILSAAPQVGIRESRNVTGEYVMTREDVVGCREFEDNVARGCYPIDIHDPGGGPTKFMFLEGGGSYGIPYRVLVPVGSKNLLVAGRCISTTHEAHGTVRIMATAMATGQAAGAAAALLSRSEKPDCARIDINELRKTLRSRNAILDRDEVI